MFEKVCEILAKFTETPVSEMRMESELLNELDIDSFNIMEAVIAFEEAFGVEIPDRQVLKLRTIGDIVTLLEGNSGQQEK